MNTCPKCKWPMIVRTSRPGSKQGQRDVYLKCDRCGHSEKKK